uniref:SFRICE_040550 n=1 Tax=Spodoptera frugiperda TaxID=7108 RepID=A0A2H1VTU3_SPOFR
MIQQTRRTPFRHQCSFLNFVKNLTEPETFPTNVKPWKSVRAFWSYSVRKENSTYFYIIDDPDQYLYSCS